MTTGNPIRVTTANSLQNRFLSVKVARAPHAFGVLEMGVLEMGVVAVTGDGGRGEKIEKGVDRRDMVPSYACIFR